MTQQAKTSIRYWKAPLLSMLFAGVLAGCAVLVPEPAPEVYDLAVSRNVASVEGGTRGQILIKEPEVVSSLNNDRIVIRPTAAKIAFFPDVRWADRLPRLLQLYLNRSFSNTNGARAVGLPGDGLVIDHQLLFDLRRFEIEQDGASFFATVEIEARILDDRNGKVVASRTFSSRKTTADRPVEAVSALNAALDDVTLELVAWVYEEI